LLYNSFIIVNLVLALTTNDSTITLTLREGNFQVGFNNLVEDYSFHKNFDLMRLNLAH